MRLQICALQLVIPLPGSRVLNLRDRDLVSTNQNEKRAFTDSGHY